MCAEALNLKHSSTHPKARNPRPLPVSWQPSNVLWNIRRIVMVVLLAMSRRIQV